jgi:hypothetical protein
MHVALVIIVSRGCSCKVLEVSNHYSLQLDMGIQGDSSFANIQLTFWRRVSISRVRVGRVPRRGNEDGVVGMSLASWCQQRGYNNKKAVRYLP